MGEAGPGAALTSATVSGMQIRYTPSAAWSCRPRTPEAGRGGLPQTNKAAAQAQGKAPGAPCSDPGGELAPAVRSGPGFLLSAREHVKAWVLVFAAPPPPSSPRSIRLERGVAKSAREGGRPTGNRSDRQPGAVVAGARSGHARQRAREEK